MFSTRLCAYFTTSHLSNAHKSKKKFTNLQGSGAKNKANALTSSTGIS